jgi:hypothetical protein
MGSKDDIAARIDADTKVKIEAMNRSVATNKVRYIYFTESRNICM